jgi:secreted PhoX family phosphatase
MSRFIARRQFLFKTAIAIAAPPLGAVIAGRMNSSMAAADGPAPGCVSTQLPPVDHPVSLIGQIGPLGPANADGLRLPDGFTARVIARSGERVLPSSSYRWHAAPDGGATYATSDGGWIYVSNCELRNNRGGVGAIRFDASANIVAAYPILHNTTRNCAGGTTPWGSWLSCEEYDGGTVWECDPYGVSRAIHRPALGTFNHEAVVVDAATNQVYLTEDKHDGCFYRFTPAEANVGGQPDLSTGILEVAVADPANCHVQWVAVPDPSAADEPIRRQVAAATRFNRGEGMEIFQGVVYFSTTGDDRIWRYDIRHSTMRVFYDAKTHPNPILTGVDNVTVSRDGEVLVAEDGGDLQIVAITQDNQLVPLIQLVGHDKSEVTGPCFTPDGKRLLFSSQRGSSGRSEDGMTFEVTGPFHLAS